MEGTLDGKEVSNGASEDSAVVQSQGVHIGIRGENAFQARIVDLISVSVKILNL